MKVIFSKNGLTRTQKIGFSWTILFFGFVPLLFRGEFWQALLLFISTMLTSGLAQVVYAFFGNRYTGRRLTAEGWHMSGFRTDDAQYARMKWDIAQ